MQLSNYLKQMKKLYIKTEKLAKQSKKFIIKNFELIKQSSLKRERIEKETFSAHSFGKKGNL